MTFDENTSQFILTTSWKNDKVQWCIYFVIDWRRKILEVNNCDYQN